jgi:DNA polymerase (family 10)
MLVEVSMVKLYRELGLSSLAEVEEAAREGRLQKIKGLGASLQTQILRGIEMQRAAQAAGTRIGRPSC